MSRAKPSWKCDNNLDNFYFSVESSVNCNVQSRQQVPSYLTGDKHRVHSYTLLSPGAQPLTTKKSRPTHLCIPSPFVSHTPSPNEDDQVVPGLQRLSVSDRISPPQTPSRAAKPLPPIPRSVDLSPDQTVDNEVEFFNGDDSRCLVSETCPKPSHFRYGMQSRRSFRECGQINYAYFEGPVPQQKKQQQKQQQQQQQPKKKHEHESQESLLPQQREPDQHEHSQHQHKATCMRQRKLRRSHSGPAGSYSKPSTLRPSCHHRNTQDLDKPEVPPRVPIPPRPIKTGDYRRWSAEVTAGTCSDDDRPPKVPPREPLSSGTSPKSLPIYHNGVMPPTQSFAPDPKYVSRGLRRQNSEGSPCILPIMENGRKASTTHYFLLPQRPTYLDKHEKYFVDSAVNRKTEASGSSLDWSCDSKKKTHSELV